MSEVIYANYIKFWPSILLMEFSLRFVCCIVNSEIDMEEFKKVMTLMRSQNRQGANHRDGRRLGVKTPIENGGLLEYFFGKDGKDCLQHDKFVQFLRQLHDEVCEPLKPHGLAASFPRSAYYNLFEAL
jgi:hypothetical protein